jgi:hypothetical protein
MLPVGYVTRCFPALFISKVDSLHAIAVELLLLPAGLNAAPDVTAATPGVQLLHSRLAGRVRKSINRKVPLLPGMRSMQLQQQVADGAGGDQGHTYRFSYAISTKCSGSPSVANMATGGAGDCWLAGISKLGERHVRLMLSLQEPRKRTMAACLQRAASTLSRQESLQQEAAGDDALQGGEQASGAAGGRAAAAEAEAPFTETVSSTLPHGRPDWWQLLLLSSLRTAAFTEQSTCSPNQNLRSHWRVCFTVMSYPWYAALRHHVCSCDLLPPSLPAAPVPGVTRYWPAAFR